MSFKIIHWNILADSLSDGFPYVDSKYLQWNYRLPLILNQLLAAKADILNLVEVDSDHASIFKTAFSGYYGFYAKKTSPDVRPKELTPSDNKEGVLMLINLKRFQILSAESFSLNGAKNGEIRSQVAVLIKLKDLETKKSMSIVGTHLKAKPGFEETRLQQMKIILKFIKKEKAIILGDLNDVPESLVCKFLLKKGFVDAYQDQKRDFTTSKKREKLVTRVIDYIFYRFYKLKVEEVVATPAVPVIGYPSKDQPSDHILIGATFKYHD